MGSRILIEILVLLSPFAVYGLYRLALSEAASEGKKPWPVQRLFLIGFALAIVAWVALLAWDKSNGGDEMCPGEKILVNGKIVQGPDVPCKRDVEGIGVPASEDPGGSSPPVETSGEDDDDT